MNRINKTNTKTIQNEPSKIQSDRPRQSKDDPRAPKSGPRPPQDDPKAPQDPPKRAQDPPKTAQDPPRRPLGTALAAILGPSKRRIDIKTIKGRKLPNAVAILDRFWSPKCDPKRPQDEPKTRQKSRRKMHDFLIALGPVLDRS